MKKILLILVAICCSQWSAAQIPTLQGKGKQTKLMVDGKPFVMLSGELHNSTASSIAYMEKERTFQRMKDMGLNSVIATISWEQFEPTEGTFDYTLMDYLLKQANEKDLRLSIIWFGTFKNPFMTYAPSWVKKDAKRFPRAVDDKGKELEMMSLFGKNIAQADAKAYATLLKYLKEKDTTHRVIMMQIENEPGLSGTYRDYSEAANKAYEGEVPAELISYLKKNKNTLQPDVKAAWEEAGCKTKGSWEEIFGKSVYEKVEGQDKILHLTEHLFTAWHYGKFLNEVSKAGKEVYALPTFVNASVFGKFARGNSLGNGCSIADFLDIYRCAAPYMDVFTPNSYMQELDWLCEQFQWKDNPILIPESTLVAARGLFVIGEHSALCFSPFGIDATAQEMNPARAKQEQLLRDSYNALSSMGNVLTDKLGTPQLRGVYLYPGHESQTITMGKWELSFGPKKGFDIGALMAPAGGGFKAEEKPKTEGGALIVQTAEDEFYVVGYGFNCDMKLANPGKTRFAGYDTIYEGHFQDGKFIPGRLLNGDERNVFAEKDELKVLKVNTYSY
ncbi:MAG: DUF5597 domain-containing protein [Bacteroidales bacterium]|nr:DUF5597 domain-containing protein [Bacteroidales bacterium]